MTLDFNKYHAASQPDRALMLLDFAPVFPVGSPATQIPKHIWKKLLEDANGDQLKAKIAWAKKPLIPWGNLQTKYPTEPQVKKWFTDYPAANIGIVTGTILVVDCDSDEAIQWVEQYLPPTPVRVDTSQGRHYYFNNGGEFRNTAGFVDIRGYGGYVLAAGSIHGSGIEYTWNILPISSEVAA